MEIELLEIKDFLAECTPFHLLEEKQLLTLPEKIQIRYLRRGNIFPPQDNKHYYHYIIRSGAIEIRDNEDTLINQLAEKGIYSDCTDFENNDLQGKTIEDTLLYQISCSSINFLRKSSKAFDDFFSSSLSKRLKQAAGNFHRSYDSGMAQMAIEVHELIKKSPLSLPQESSIQLVAKEMTEKEVSSALLMQNKSLTGIITDRDLRRRCIAKAMDVSLPVSSIMTTQLDCIEADDLVLNALILMTKKDVHHLPVVKGDDIIGILTASDLAHHNSSNPAFIISDIRKSTNLNELVAASKRLPELQLQLSNASVTAQHTGEIISRITDAITARLIELTEEETGTAPVPYVWVSGGSQARREQTSHSDQDNALIISDTFQEKDVEWFKNLAQKVTDGLNACGFVYCPGNAMASNKQWRQPLAEWKQYFSKWIDTPQPRALMLSSIFFDLRAVHGDRTLLEQLQSFSLNKTRNAGIFIAYMAANALTHRPPLGFFRRFVLIHDGEHNEMFDIKHRGITPIIDIARLLALSEGIKATNTIQRLRAVSQTSALSEEMAENLEGAFAFISELRICHQSNQIKKGIPADNFLSPGKLTELDRKHLKDAFSVIQQMQDLLEQRFNTGRLG